MASRLSGHHPHHHGAGGGPRHHHHAVDHDMLRPHTHIAYHHVEQACGAEVEKICAPKKEVPETFGDPLLDWVFLPQAPRPVDRMSDPTVMFDRMFNSFFADPMTTVTIFFQDDIRPQEQAPLIVDSMTAKLAADKTPEEIPDLVHTLRSHGKQLLTLHEADTMGHRMARRLSEVDANTLQHHARLPFGCPKNKCLREAVVAGKVSQECATSIRQYETTYILEEQLEHRQDVFVGMMWVYIIVLSALLILLARNYRNHHGQQRLRTKILRAIYSNPVLKEKLEHELGESVGSAPPLPAHVLRLMSAGGRDLRRQLQCLKRVHTVFFVALLTLVFVAPFWVLPICIIISVVRVVLLCFMNNEPVDGECECCCCGANTTDAANGNLTVEQECCGCCKGTGVCAVGCKDCCGPDGCCCCGCCDTDCSCCDGGVCKITDKEEVEGCCCCCCGASEEDAKNGTLTDAQACCSCCSGSGCCGSSCCCCSTSEVKGRGQKHVVPAQTRIYEGVPLQVV